MSFGKTAFVLPMLCLLAACGTATAPSNDASGNTVAPVTTNGTAVAAVNDPTAFKVGTNLTTISNWDGARPFMNLLYGGNSWSMVNTSTWASQPIPAEDLDTNGWVKTLPAGYMVSRGMSAPVAGGNFICRFQGNGSLNVAGGAVSNVVKGTGQTTFTIAPAAYPNPQFPMVQYTVDPTNYIRNIDCREASASTTAIFSPEFLAAAQGFKVLRFMKWYSPSVEGNSGTKAAWGGGTQASPNYLVTWATRNKPGDANYLVNDGVPVEWMVELANEEGADPWFAMPWNADDNYITQFATYVRDHLAPGHQAYVELSNEVWNGSYPVYTQACAEAKAEALPNAADPTTVGCAGERYAEKTQHVMDIWKNVFAATGQSSQLVRVFAWQHVNSWASDKLLAYMNTYQHVDALATAPYWGDGSKIGTMSLDQIMTSYLPGEITSMLNFGTQQKAIAQKYNLRYVTYESGQGIVLPSNISLEQQIERDPRMTDLYTSFISQWQNQIGDTLTLFTLHGGINQYGGWGMYEYVGQPLSDSPKMQAVKQFLGLSTTTASVDPTTTTVSSPTTTTTTITCPDGSVIASTSTCPTTSTSSGSTTTSTGSTSGSTTTSTGGKKNGATRGKNPKLATV